MHRYRLIIRYSSSKNEMLIAFSLFLIFIFNLLWLCCFLSAPWCDNDMSLQDHIPTQISSCTRGECTACIPVTDNVQRNNKAFFRQDLYETICRWKTTRLFNFSCIVTVLLHYFLIEPAPKNAGVHLHNLLVYTRL